MWTLDETKQNMLVSNCQCSGLKAFVNFNDLTNNLVECYGSVLLRYYCIFNYVIKMVFLSFKTIKKKNAYFQYF